MNCNDVKEGLKVVTTTLGSTRGMCILDKYLACRGSNKTGVVDGYVAGHGGDVWWVIHDDGSVGAYFFTEFEEQVLEEQVFDKPFEFLKDSFTP